MIERGQKRMRNLHRDGKKTGVHIEIRQRDGGEEGVRQPITSFPHV